MGRFIDDFVRRARSGTRQAGALARDDPAVWRVLAPGALLAVVFVLVLTRRAGAPVTQVLSFVGTVWLIVGLTTWYGDDDGDAEAMTRVVRGSLPRHDVERPAIARTLAVPAELRRPADHGDPADDGDPADVEPPAAVAG